MTDSRNARTQVQVLVQSTPTALNARQQVQVLATLPPATAWNAREQVQTLSQVVPPTALMARSQVQVLLLRGSAVRTVGSARPLLMKDPDGTWKPVITLA